MSERKSFSFGENYILQVKTKIIVLVDEFRDVRIGLNYQKFAKLRESIVDVDKAIKQQQETGDANLRIEIGQMCYVAVNNGYYCVDVRKWFIDRGGKVRPTKKGLSFNFDEWIKFKEVVEEMRTWHPDVMSVVPCYYGGDHFNQEGSLYRQLTRICQTSLYLNIVNQP